VGKGTRVGVLMTNRPEFLSAVFGAALAGCTATTLSTFSTEAELDYLLKVSGISVLLAERRVLKKDFVELLANLEPALRSASPGALVSARYPFLRHVAAVGDGGFGGMVEPWDTFLARGRVIDPAVVAARNASVTPADPALLLFSSGSTAKPKGVLSAHRSIALQMWRWRRFYGSREDARTWAANGFFWSGNFGQVIAGTISAGGCLILQKTFDAEGALALMELEKATMAIAWPHQWEQLAAAPNFATVDLSAMHYISPANALGKHPSIRTDWQEPWAAYGNTETFTISAIFPSGTPEETIGTSNGTPQPGMVFKIVDPLTGKMVPMGQTGEIAVKGPTLMLGYLGVPLDETLDDTGFFRTGDGGHVDHAPDGTPRLYWHGRLNDIIKTGGANVSPLEIDALLLTYPGVKISQSVGVPHETLGEMVVGCVVPHEGVTLDEEALRNFAKASLASYKVPRRVLFFAENELKTTGTAKVLTADLRKLAAARLAGEAA
jgi:acyl-CoA synthetase (AMP-forming)/AMP-acid ligase II